MRQLSKEAVIELGFLVFGLIFFTFSMRQINRAEQEAWLRSFVEKKEFGIPKQKPTDPETKSKK